MTEEEMRKLHNHGPEVLCNEDCPQDKYTMRNPIGIINATGNDFDDLLKYKLIREMSKEELIAELIDTTREHLEKHDISDLKAQVINGRMASVHERMLREAGLKQERGFMGFPRMVEDEENEPD